MPATKNTPMREGVHAHLRLARTESPSFEKLHLVCGDSPADPGPPWISPHSSVHRNPSASSPETKHTAT